MLVFEELGLRLCEASHCAFLVVTRTEAKAKSLGSKNGFRWVLSKTLKSHTILQSTRTKKQLLLKKSWMCIQLNVCAPLEFRDTDLNPANEWSVEEYLAIFNCPRSSHFLGNGRCYFFFVIPYYVYLILWGSDMFYVNEVSGLSPPWSFLLK